MTRAILGARPCGRRTAVQNGYPAILSNKGSNPIAHHHLKEKSPILRQGSFLLDGGEGGIRTLDTLPYTHFPGVLLQPLGHLTVVELLFRREFITCKTIQSFSVLDKHGLHTLGCQRGANL